MTCEQLPLDSLPCRLGVGLEMPDGRPARRGGGQPGSPPAQGEEFTPPLLRREAPKPSSILGDHRPVVGEQDPDVAGMSMRGCREYLASE